MFLGNQESNTWSRKRTNKQPGPVLVYTSATGDCLVKATFKLCDWVNIAQPVGIKARGHVYWFLSVLDGWKWALIVLTMSVLETTA